MNEEALPEHSDGMFSHILAAYNGLGREEEEESGDCQLVKEGVKETEQ